MKLEYQLKYTRDIQELLPTKLFGKRLITKSGKLSKWGKILTKNK